MPENTTQTVGPLTAMAIADAYGVGFEFTHRTFIHKHNHLKRYTVHPKCKRTPGAYSDDTQMTLGLVEHMLSGDTWTPLALASRWVEVFHRDPRTGYAKGFYQFLLETRTGETFLRNIRPDSVKNGGAMRAFPIGFHRDINLVRNLAMQQASLTHATWEGMTAAAAAALMFYHRYHRVGSKDQLPDFLTLCLPGVSWGTCLSEPVSTEGLLTVRAAIRALMLGSSLADVIQIAVTMGGDTDTVAAIAAPAAAVCPETLSTIPPALLAGLESGTYGREYLQDLDIRLTSMFPPSWSGKTPVRIPAAPVPPAKPPSEAGPLDFLFED